jgi:hypothetical protein
MAQEMRITIRLVELKGGGYIIAEELVTGEHVEFDATQAVSTIDEACGSLQRRLRDWSQDCKRLKMAEIEDESRGRVIAPRRWWRNAE